MKVHPFAAKYPMMSEAQIAELAVDIQKNGQIHAIVFFNDELLDGRNRLAACELAGIEPRKVVLGACESPVSYIISVNDRRRHMSAVQLAAMAAEAVPYYEEEAKSRQRSGKSADGSAGGRGKKKPSPQTMGKDSKHDGEATRQAAKATGAGILATEFLHSIRLQHPRVFDLAKDGRFTIEDAKRLVGIEDDATRNMVLDLVEAGESVIEARRKVVAQQISKRGTTEVSGKYRIIYADPPWSYGNSMPDGTSVPADYYPPMSLDAICNLEVASGVPVKDIAEDNAVLFLWTTSPHLEESFQVIKAWGFKYKTSFIWDKVKHNMGHYNSVRHELLLVCVRGSCQPDERKLFDSVVTEERTEHSRKPDCFYNIIDTIYTHGDRIELFCRRPRDGWKVWGFEAADAA